jgi:diguanylate cyclase (GGDEF)-like protein/PAS domain S-box-containing protein
MRGKTDRAENATVPTGPGQSMRQRAEEIARKNASLGPQNSAVLSPRETELLLHELHVHQIQLEMQNEELRQAQAELDATRARYYDLYDLAPVGYVTVSEKGLIQEANLTATTLLGVARGALVHRPLTRFILKADQDVYYKHRKQLFKTAEPQACELRLVRSDGIAFTAYLEATASRDSDGETVCRVALSDITECKQTEIQLQYLSMHDALTGLNNRAYFEETLERLDRGRQFPISILMADVDNLKLINDLQGHAAGDSMLRSVAHLLTVSFRAEDVIARVGGDEFAVLMPSTTAEQAEGALLRFRSILQEHNGHCDSHPVGLSCGIGTAEHGVPLLQALKNGDSAMYREKQALSVTSRPGLQVREAFPISSSGPSLRRQAEEMARSETAQSSENTDLVPAEHPQYALHELRVHQIELEMQNQELRTAHADLDQSRARYFDLYNLAPVAYFTLSEQSLIIEANLTAVSMLGVVRSALEKQRFTQFIYRQDQDIFYLHRKQLFGTGEPQACELRMVTKDGAVFWAQMAATVAQDAEGAPVCFVVMSDISVRKQTEDELRQSLDLAERSRRALLSALEDLQSAEAAIQQLNESLERRIDERTAQLQVAVDELDSFSYSVSHDLRSPLRAINGFSNELFEDYGGRLDDNGRSLLFRIQNASVRMGDLIDGLMALSRLSRLDLDRSLVDLSDMAERLVGRLKASHPSHPVKCSIAAGLAAYADPAMAEIILQNLLGNAWKYTGKQPGAEVEFGSFDLDGETVFFVRDNGVGYDEAGADKLFGAFQRLHSAKEYPGNGIGLATVKRAVNRHEGRVWAEGAMEKGATFYFTLGPKSHDSP